MAKIQNNTPAILGRFKGMGLTFYRRGDDIVARSSYKSQPSHQSSAQFRSRERVRRLIALWNAFPDNARPVMETPDGLIPYRAFLRINSQVPAAYLTAQQHKAGGAVLVPGLCVSAGRIDPIEYRFDALPDGRRLVVTSLRTTCAPDLSQPLAPATAEAFGELVLGSDLNPSLRTADLLRFYCLSQGVKHTDEADAPVVQVRCADVPLEGKEPVAFLKDHELYTHHGYLAVACPDIPDVAYAVAILDPRHHTASTQCILTTSTCHDPYTTPDAATRAATSYGNVRDKSYRPESDKR